MGGKELPTCPMPTCPSSGSSLGGSAPCARPSQAPLLTLFESGLERLWWSIRAGAIKPMTSQKACGGGERQEYSRVHRGNWDAAPCEMTLWFL